MLSVDNEPLARDPETGAFKNADIAALIQAATEAPAGAFKARGIPEVMRVVEVLGIEQARQWGTASVIHIYIIRKLCILTFRTDERVQEVHGSQAIRILLGVEFRPGCQRTWEGLCHRLYQVLTISPQKTAEALYGHIDNLELYPGLMAEESKPPIAGAGLCPGYTISRAILADAVALVRGDRFLTTDFNGMSVVPNQFCSTD